MKRKKCYDTPLIARSQVEIEDGLCAGSLTDTQSHEVKIKRQDGEDNGIIVEDSFGSSDTWE